MGMELLSEQPLRTSHLAHDLCDGAPLLQWSAHRATSTRRNVAGIVVPLAVVF